MLFRDPELRIISPLSLIILVLLVSVKYIVDPGYIFIIAVISVILFSYLFNFLLVYIAFFLLHPGLRKRGDDKRRHRILWVVRLITMSVILIELYFFNVPFLNLILLLFFGSLYIWAGIESILFTKFAWDISKKIRSVGIRVVVYLLISIAYGLYLTFMLLKPLPSTSEWIDDTLLDWMLSLLLFSFALAKIGKAFSPASAGKSSTSIHKHPLDEFKLRTAVLSVFILAIGFEVVTRGLPTFFPNMPVWTFIATNGYYFLRIVYFWPCFIVGFIWGIIRATRKAKQS